MSNNCYTFTLTRYTSFYTNFKSSKIPTIYYCHCAKIQVLLFYCEYSENLHFTRTSWESSIGLSFDCCILLIIVHFNTTIWILITNVCDTYNMYLVRPMRSDWNANSFESNHEYHTTLTFFEYNNVLFNVNKSIKSCSGYWLN